ncbi:hypothetical protein ACFWC9_39560 [Streptomyces goshikiensis]|uniref:hypothetical protein n=1 Tax=Streptomyces goshikiensis TaxID=1942 RepID=UPI0036BEEBCF
MEALMTPQPSPATAGFEPHSGTGPFGSALRCLLTGVLTVSLAMTALIGIPTRAHATILGQSPVTWNMQHGNVRQWNNDVAALVRGGKFQREQVGEHSIVALQEAGTLNNVRSLVRGVNRTPQRQGNHAFTYNRNPQEPAFTLNFPWYEFEWVVPGRRGTPGTRVYIYYLVADVSATGQLGVAIISHRQAARVIVMDPQPNANGKWPQRMSQTGNKQRPRAALGIELPTNEIFWSSHMTVAGDNNAVAVINEAANLSAGKEWAVLADFNRVPEGLGLLGPNMHIYRPNSGTQQALTSTTKRELDYMVSNTVMPGWTGVVIAKERRPEDADHWPVEFRFRAAGEDPDEGGDPPIMSGKDRTKCITIVRQTSQRLAKSQPWDPSPRLMRCAYYPSQDWALTDGHLTNTTVGYGTLCLVGNNTKVMAGRCGPPDPGVAAQRWTYHETAGTLVNGSGRCLENRANVLVLAVCDTDTPLSQQWYFPGASAFTVHVNSASKVVVNQVHQSGQLGTGDGTEGEIIGANFTKALPAYLPEGLTVVALDGEGKVKKNVKDNETGAWSGWAQVREIPSRVTDISVSVFGGKLYIASTGSGVHVHQDGVTKTVAGRGGWTRIANVVVPAIRPKNGRFPGRNLVFLYNPGDKVINFKEPNNIAPTGRVVLPVGAESLVVSSLGADLHLQYAATNGQVYATTIDITGEEWEKDFDDHNADFSEVVVSGAKVAGAKPHVTHFSDVEADDLGAYELANLSSTETDSIIALCGIRKTDGRPGCAERKKYEGLPPQRWSKFLCYDKEDDKALRIEMAYVVYKGTHALCDAPKSRGLSLVLP